MEVTYHRRQIAGPFAYHDWLKIGDDHYEIGVPGGDNKGIQEVRVSRHPSGRPQQGSSAGGCSWPCSLGTTDKSTAEIQAFNNIWCQQHRYYNIRSADCQEYTRQLAEFLEVMTQRIPTRDGAVALVFVNGAQGAATIENDTRQTITVKTYDEADGVCWSAYEVYQIAPGKKQDCVATGGMGRSSCQNIQVSVNGSSCYTLKTAQVHKWDGRGFRRV